MEKGFGVNFYPSTGWCSIDRPPAVKTERFHRIFGAFVVTVREAAP